MVTYRGDIEKQPREIGHNPIDVFIVLHEAMSLAISDFSNHVKSVELQPLGKITALGLVHIDIPRLFEEELGGVVHKRLVLDQRRHGKGRVDASPETGVEVIVC